MKVLILTVITLAALQHGTAIPLPQDEDTQPKKECSSVCPAIFAPVCGSDGKTYDSTCKLEFSNCLKGTSVIVVDEGECQGAQQPLPLPPKPTPPEKTEGSGDQRQRRQGETSPVTCNGKCNRDFKQVCGSNDETYNNLCLLEFAACDSKKEITKVSDGPCKEEKRAGLKSEEPKISEDKSALPIEEKAAEDKKEEEVECNAKCVREFKPVCGSDGETYNSPCLLELASCQSNNTISKVSDGPCGSENHESGNRDGKQLNNDHSEKKDDDDEQKKETTNQDKKEETGRNDNKDSKPDAPKLTKDAKPDAPKLTKDAPKPHVDDEKEKDSDANEGSGDDKEEGTHDTKTIEIEIDEEKEAEKYQTHDDKDAQDEKDKCAQFRCSRELKPVCGSNNRTYNTECFMNYQTCQEGIEVTKVHDGPCGEPEDHNNNNNQTDAEAKEDGDAIIVERSADESDQESNDGEKNQACQEVCPLDIKPVCGSNRELYANRCLLEQAACKQGRKITIAECRQNNDN